ncbi:hypothetical protein CS8_034600 [Cupriavidus sp. 8B]
MSNTKICQSHISNGGARYDACPKMPNRRHIMKIDVNEGDGYFSLSRSALEQHSALKSGRDCMTHLAEWVADPTKQSFRPTHSDPDRIDTP